MNKFIITTDTTADLPADYVAEHNLGMLSLTYTIDVPALCLPPLRSTRKLPAKSLQKLPQKMTVIFFTLPFPADSAAATPVRKLLQVKWKKIISHIKSLS